MGPVTNWSDVNFELRTVRVTAKPNLGFYPKRWEDREVPAPVELLEELRKLTHHPNCQFVFPSPTGNREQHMLDHCKAIAMRAELDPTGFDLKTFRSTYATGMLRRGFDVRTVQHWMGPQVPGDYDALSGASHRRSRRSGLGYYSVYRQGRTGAPKVRRARDPFNSQGGPGMIGQPPRIGTRGPATLSHGIRLISNREERLGQTH
jgi:hypothetical protein